MFCLDNTIYECKDILSLLPTDIEIIKNNKKIEYLNVSSAFDIESTSFKVKEEKRAFMYAWVFGINGKCIIGRTWSEFLNICQILHDKMNLSETRRLVVYIHNLSFEFGFFRKLFKWDTVFSLDTREVCYCINDLGIEFRCSYILSGYSLAQIGKNLLKYKVNKMVGDLDYKLIRHSKTPLTDKEKGYILNDGLVVMAYIQEKIETDGDITKIPLTKTGYVRRQCRNNCLYGGGGKHSKSSNQYLKYHRMISSLCIKSVDEYIQLQNAFAGGFTHANAFYNGFILYNLDSYDLTSSYPTSMVAYYYPMSSGRLVTIKSNADLKKYLNAYCCLFDIEFENIKAVVTSDHPISYSKCRYKENVVVDNGRVVSADKIVLTITEIDFNIFRKFYKWDKMLISNFRVYRRGYLPKELVLTILNFYKKKTELKGVKGMEAEYMSSKQDVNSCYGMMVTNILRDEILYTDDIFIKSPPDVKETLEKYNSSKNRFLFYPWGIWVTAHSRARLLNMIYKLGDKYVYSDTDSIKGYISKEFKKVLLKDNEMIKYQLLKACKYHQIDELLVHPKTIEGVEKWLGVWDFDNHYKSFKTLGSKRYMYIEEDETLHMTISGVNGKYAIPYLQSKYKNNIKVLENFKNDLEIPKGFTGKNLHCYLDYEVHGTVTDYLGNDGNYHEESGIYIEETSYTLNLSKNYIDYLIGLKDYAN